MDNYHRDFDGVRLCNMCKGVLRAGWPRLVDPPYLFCGDCSFLVGACSEKEYLSMRGCYPQDKYSADIEEGKIFVYFGKKRNKNAKDRRTSPEYQKWRSLVFERDRYTCRQCGNVGGTLNAHHIKSYKNHRDLRLCVDNGITLCESPCHKQEHKSK